MIRRILLSLSADPFASPTISHAVDLAKRHDAKITGIGIVDVERCTNVGPVPTGGVQLAADLGRHRLTEAMANLEKTAALLAERCRTEEVRHEIHIKEGDPLDELKSQWRYHDLTIIAIRSPFDCGLDEPSANDHLKPVIHAGLKPILAVPEGFSSIRRVVAAYNGSSHSAKAIKRFVQKRLWPDAVIKIVTFLPKKDRPEDLLQKAAEYCRDHGFEVETEHPKGTAKRQLLPAAESSQADLIILGATPRMRFKEVMLGDTTTEALKRSKIPLFLAQ